MNLRSRLAIVLVATASISNAQADQIIVTSESDFLALVGDVTREGFESFPTNSDCTGGGSTVSSSVLTVTSNSQGDTPSWLCVGTTAAGLPGPTEGNNALIAGGGANDGWILSFVLAEAADAVYFELTDAVERGDAFLLLEGLDPILVAGQGSGGLNDILFGIVLDSPVSSFSLLNTGQFDGWGVDNMIFATAVPEPSTLALLSLGLLGLGLSRRKKV